MTSPSGLVGALLGGADDRIAVTGATGWLGSVADGRTAQVLPLSALAAQTPGPTAILHFGYLTRDKVATLGVDAYTAVNVAITATVLDAIETHRPRHVVVASSGAVHAPNGRYAHDLPGDPYGTLKRIDELAFTAATQQVGGTCVIPRVFSVAGPRMTKPDLYALGSMIRLAEAGGPVVVRARGPVYRSYCGVDEVVALSLWLAHAGRDVVFDTCGTVVEMRELADVVAQVHGLPASAVERTWDPSAPADRYVGDGRTMESFAVDAGLALASLPDLVRRTSAWLTSATTPDDAAPGTPLTPGTEATP